MSSEFSFPTVMNAIGVSPYLFASIIAGENKW
jgi:hypothetical protein